MKYFNSEHFKRNSSSRTSQFPSAAVRKQVQKIPFFWILLNCSPMHSYLFKWATFTTLILPLKIARFSSKNVHINEQKHVQVYYFCTINHNFNYTAYFRIFESKTQKKFYQHFPTLYIWDDHDFGDNNSGSSSLAKESATEMYLSIVPHYPFRTFPHKTNVTYYHTNANAQMYCVKTQNFAQNIFQTIIIFSFLLSNCSLKYFLFSP